MCIYQIFISKMFGNYVNGNTSWKNIRFILALISESHVLVTTDRNDTFNSTRGAFFFGEMKYQIRTNANERDFQTIKL
jgi:hypothetical protein